MQPTIIEREGKLKLVLFARVLYVQPDERQYQQNSHKVVPSPVVEFDKPMEEMTPLYFAIEIPLTSDYVWNFKDYSKFVENSINESLGYDTPKESEPKELPLPILTKEGLEFYHNELKVYEQQPTYEPNNNDDEDFGNW